MDLLHRERNFARVLALTSAPGVIIAAAERGVRLIQNDNNSYRLSSTLKGHKAVIYSVCSIDDTAGLIATGSADRTVGVWTVTPDMAEIAADAFLFGHRGGVSALCSQPMGHLICSGSKDKTIKVWDPDNIDAKLVMKRKDLAICTINAHTACVTCCNWKEDNIFSGSVDSTVKVWDAATGAKAKNINCKGIVHTLDVAIDSVTVAAGVGDGRLYIEDIRSKERISDWEAHTKAIKGVKWHPTSTTTLVSGGFDGIVKCWDLRYKKKVHEELDLEAGKLIHCVAWFGEHQNQVIVGDKDSVYLSRPLPLVV